MNADPFKDSLSRDSTDSVAGNGAYRAPRVTDDEDEPVVRLSDSRAQLREMLDIDQRPDDGEQFPRSKAMRMLIGKPGMIAAAVAVGGLLIMRPRIVKSALRAMPTQQLWRLLAARLLHRGG